MSACNARTRSGGRCKNAPMENGRCAKHGGKTPSGAASPHWKHGRYSRYMPKRLLERTHELLADPDVLSLEPNLRLIDAQIVELIESLGGHDLLSSLDDLVRHKKALDAAMTTGNTEAQGNALALLLAAIEGAKGKRDTMRTIGTLSEQRRRLVETEVRRYAVAANVMSLDRVNGLFLAVMELVMREIPDVKTKQRIALQLRKLVSRATDDAVDGDLGGVEVNELPAPDA